MGIDANVHAGQAVYTPKTVVANVLESDMPLDRPFRSVGLCHLLHCLPGLMAEKAAVFDHVMPLMADGAVLFGPTLVQGDAPRSRPAQALMDVYNRKGVFTNAADTHDDLAAELKKRFGTVSLARHGAVTAFEARNPLPN